VLAGIVVLALAGCGGGSKPAKSTVTPPVSQSGTATPSGPPLGFPIVATKNTTRVAGADPIADAAGVALATFPARTPESKPAAVILADVGDWRTGIGSGLSRAGAALPGAMRSRYHTVPASAPCRRWPVTTNVLSSAAVP